MHKMHIYIYIYIYASFLSPFLYMAHMIPILEVKPMAPRFPQESKTSKNKGASSFEKCLKSAASRPLLFA